MLAGTLTTSCSWVPNSTMRPANTARAFLLREHGNPPGYLGPLRYHLAFAKGWSDSASLVFEPHNREIVIQCILPYLTVTSTGETDVWHGLSTHAWGEPLR